MGLAATASIRYDQRSASPSEPHSLQSGAYVRIHSGELHGMVGTVICRRGGDRLLVSPLDIRGGVCVEIDARMVEFVDGPD